MAHTLKSVSFFAIFFIVLLATSEMPMVEGKVCSRLSKTWSGWCGNSGNCNRQCRDWEGAKHGACHARFPGMACFCYFKCKA